MLKPVSILLMIAIAAPASAQITFEEPTKVESAKPKATDKIICEREEVLGSRLGGKKVCMTAEQWQEQQARHREQLEKFQQQNTSVGSPVG